MYMDCQDPSNGRQAILRRPPSCAIRVAAAFAAARPRKEPMSRIAYVNGRYRPWREATVHVEDRGYQFSDGVYEVCEVRGGRLIDERRHMARLERSLAALCMAMPMSPAALGVVMRETIRRNRVDNGLVYLQISRGVARRDHAFPPAGTAPAVVVTARSIDGKANE